MNRPRLLALFGKSNMWQVKLRLAFVVALLIVLALAGVVGWQAGRIGDLRRGQSDQARLVANLRDRLRIADRPQPPAEPEEESAEPVRPQPRNPGRQDTSALENRDAQIRALQQDLADARTNIGKLESRIAAMETDQQAAATTAAERLTAEETDWKTRLDNLTRQLDAAQAEAQVARQHAADLAAAAARFKNAPPVATTNTAESARLLARLQDLNRRRDTYLTSILRRYREVTSQFHAMSGMLNSSHDQSANPMSASVLTRIETALSLAEDDMRQFNELNVQAQQAEKKLAASLAAQSRANP
jgi:hypothetical protein